MANFGRCLLLLNIDLLLLAILSDSDMGCIALVDLCLSGCLVHIQLNVTTGNQRKETARYYCWGWTNWNVRVPWTLWQNEISIWSSMTGVCCNDVELRCLRWITLRLLYIYLPFQIFCLNSMTKLKLEIISSLFFLQW